MEVVGAGGTTGNAHTPGGVMPDAGALWEHEECIKLGFAELSLRGELQLTSETESSTSAHLALPSEVECWLTLSSMSSLQASPPLNTQGSEKLLGRQVTKSSVSSTS
jgi:hypothetical protein